MICWLMHLRLRKYWLNLKRVGDAIFVAHNASFDMGFIDTGYERLGFGPSTNGVIDTLELSRTINTEYGKHGLNF